MAFREHVLRQPLAVSGGQHGRGPHNSPRRGRRTRGCQSGLQDGEGLFAVFDDTSFDTSPERVTAVFTSLQGAPWPRGIHINPGKIKVWSAAGVKPPGCDAMQGITESFDPTALVWRGSELSTFQQGMKVLATPLGHPDFVRANLEWKSISHQWFLDRIPLMEDVQASWLLLVHCAAALANYMTRVLEPASSLEFCERNDLALWHCLCNIMQISPSQAQDIRQTATMPMILGGLGLRSAVRVREAASWSSWADCLPMVHQRHPSVAANLVVQLRGGAQGPFFRAAAEAVQYLEASGFEAPTWKVLACGVRPVPREPEDLEPGVVRRGWQHAAASAVELHAREELFSQVSDQVKALARSQGRPGAGAPFTAIPSHLFRVLLLRRLRQPLPFTGRACRCGRLLDAFGHHRAACGRVGVLSRRGSSGECSCTNLPRGWWARAYQYVRADVVWKSSWTVSPCMATRSWLRTQLL